LKERKSKRGRDLAKRLKERKSKRGRRRERVIFNFTPLQKARPIPVPNARQDRCNLIFELLNLTPDRQF
jgi:hypothetical protein